jgi:hypothetical protein
VVQTGFARRACEQLVDGTGCIPQPIKACARGCFRNLVAKALKGMTTGIEAYVR